MKSQLEIIKLKLKPKLENKTWTETRTRKIITWTRNWNSTSTLKNYKIPKLMLEEKKKEIDFMNYKSS